MQIKEKLIEIGKLLPRGSRMEIAKATGVRPNTVNGIFAGKILPDYETLEKILPLAKEIAEKTKKLLD